MNSYSVVGKRLPRVDGLGKVTGSTEFSTDLSLPGTLYARLLRSPHPHARIISVDTSRAERLPGVEAIVTAKDVPDVATGVLTHDYPIFARHKVRYIGEPVAAVAAISAEIATEALDLITVEYEELPAVFDPFEALQAGAPQVHESHSDVFVGPHKVDGNICAQRTIRRGDVKRGFEESDIVVHNTFRTQAVEHCHIEPHGTSAIVDSSGKATVWTGTQSPFSVRGQLAHALQMPVNKIRVISTPMGGAFGGKSDLMCEPYCLVLAKRTGRPVKMVATREEEFIGSTIRHPMTIQFATGLKRDGTITARQIKVVLDCGAYCDVGDITLDYACIFVNGPYRVPNLEIEGVLVYTNHHIGGPMRGFGAMQAAFAYESEMDIIAEKLGMDPIELRRKNFLSEGDLTATGQKVEWAGPRATFDAVLERVDWRGGLESADPKKKRGRGIACVNYASGVGNTVDYAGATLKMNEDGSVNVSVSNAEEGQGSVTVLSQIAAEELGLRLEDVTISSYDTDSTPLDTIGACASRTTYVCGGAVKAAAEKAREQLLQIAAQLLEASVQDLELKDRMVSVKGSPDRAMPVAIVCLLGSLRGQVVVASEVFRTDTGPIDSATGQGKPFDYFTYASAVADVEVDTETGNVEVLRVVAAHDCGKAINPMNVEGQVQGGVTMGVGFTLTEEIQRDKGRTLNPDFTDYRIPTAHDVPRIETVILEAHGSKGPFGAKGVGEPPIMGVAPAIANAVCNAVGIRVTDLPLKQEKLYFKLRELSIPK